MTPETDSPARTLGDLASASNVICLSGDPTTPIHDIQYDSRLVTPGCMFVALRGGYFDGHDFVQDAVNRGAVAIMSEAEIPGIPSLRFENTRRSLPEVSASFFDYPAASLRLIGITGTDGKTTTSHIVNSILESVGIVTGLTGTVAVKIAGEVVEHETRQTTPESLEVQRTLALMRNAGVEWAILEATSHGLETSRLGSLDFDIGAVTNVTLEHLEFHGSLEAYRRAKARLFENVGNAGGTAIVNLSDRNAQTMASYADGATHISYGLDCPQADFWADNVSCTASGTSFVLHRKLGESRSVSTPMLGTFNVENVLCAIAIADSAGVDLDAILDAVSRVEPVPGRLVRVDEGQEFAVVVDYAHTPESLERLLLLMKDLNPVGKLICVSGSAGERDTAKRPLQGAVSARLADFSIFTTEDPRFEDASDIIDEIAEGAEREGARRDRDFIKIVDRQEAIDRAIDIASSGDTVVLTGKGHERSIIWGHEKRPWDEIDAARQSIRRLGRSGTPNYSRDCSTSDAAR